MSVPDFQSLMRPVLVLLSDGESHEVQNIRDTLAKELALTEDDLAERLPSGLQFTWVNRVAWALSHLKGAGCIERLARGLYRITERGRELLATVGDERIEVSTLNQFTEYRSFRASGTDGDEDAAGDKWDEAIALCRAILADRESFDAHEVSYKLEVAENISAAFDAASAGDPVAAPIAKSFGKPNNLLSHFQVIWFRDWMKKGDEGARAALLALTADGSLAERVDAFNECIPGEVLKSPGAKIAFAAFFLMGSDPAEYPMYRPQAIKGAEKILGWPDAPSGATLGEQYSHHVDFVSHFRDRLVEAGLDVKDMLDAQSLIWMLMKWGEPEFLAFRGEAEAAASSGGKRGRRSRTRSMGRRALPGPFYGPPGTGKTYLARKLAEFVTDGERGRKEIVQFHPSYSYEDFVQGYRPIPGEGNSLGYELVDGPLVRLAESARREPEATHVLLIDEINRGNLPRIFGELLYLLEYRDDDVTLMYGAGRERFALPANLWIVGTMNTADRSIGLIDAALRRRFHFTALFPGRPPLDGLLARWLDDQASTMSPVADYVETLNEMLRERFGDHLQIGHSYFMSADLDDARLEQIWEADIMPFLEDQLFGKESELGQFRLAAIKDRSESPLEPSAEVTDEDDQADGVRQSED